MTFIKNTTIDSTKKKRLPAAKRRKQLLDAALKVFSWRGYDAATMDDIAEEAGVTKPLLYQHFKSKRALYLELINDISLGIIGQVTAATTTAQTPRLRVELGFRAYFSYVIQHENAFRLLFGRGAPHDKELTLAVRKVEMKMAETLAPLIEIDISPEHRKLLAHGVIGIAEASSRYWLSFASQETPTNTSIESANNLAKHVADLTWSGLRGIQPDQADYKEVSTK